MNRRATATRMNHRLNPAAVRILRVGAGWLCMARVKAARRLTRRRGGGALWAAALLAAAAAGHCREDAADADIPAGETLHWGKEPVEQISETRGRVCLNGLWRFVPAPDADTGAPERGWGFTRVPGAARWWEADAGVFRGRGPVWQTPEGTPPGFSLYERLVHVPAQWADRAVLIDLQPAGMTARVSVNGIPCGTVEPPGGRPDITRAVIPGEDALVRLRLGGPSSLGGMGDVFLVSRPAGARIGDVFVRTSTRTHEVTVDVELADVAGAGEADVTAVMLDEAGREEQRFGKRVRVKKAPLQTLSITWPWEDPRLWDWGTPNLYTLRLRVAAAGLADEYARVFGFREIWLEGRDFVLNGKRLRFRPCHGIDGDGVIEKIDELIEQYRAMGFNLVLPAPRGDAPGGLDWSGLLAERADRKGIMLALPLPLEPFPGDRLRRYRNHPSIVMWGAQAGFPAHPQDQNPLLLGRRGWADGDAAWRAGADAAQQALQRVKDHDPTRPVIVYDGAYTGDVFSPRVSLGLLPLQEREEWLSAWHESGEMPLMLTRLGIPHRASLCRGRGAGATEPLATEFCAIYFGAKAYRRESEAYRRDMVSRFREAQQYGGRRQDLPGGGPLFDLYALFIGRTWRSWRTSGLTGGMAPWQAPLRAPGETRTVNLPAFEPGRRGRYVSSFRVPAGALTAAGEALRTCNGETAAWIAGPADAFTAKDHATRAGQEVHKQVILINDSRSRRPFRVAWTVSVAGSAVERGTQEGEIGAADTLRIPLSFRSTDAAAGSRREGLITLAAVIGGTQHRDTFAFRVFGPPKTSPGRAVILDPQGRTRRMLALLGWQTSEWNGGDADRLLVIGREALSDGVPPGDVEAFVRRGGRALVMTQQPEWLRGRMGWRVCPRVSRRAFVVPTCASGLEGLDEAHLRDWRGESTLVDAYPDYLGTEHRRNPQGMPFHGWHWGNRGGVSSAAIEKPHYGGWRPLLECEFDLAYTPLMEIDLGAGRLTWCTLDLEDHARLDPAAEDVARRVLRLAARAVTARRAASTVYLGGPRGEKLLGSLGIRFESGKRLPSGEGLVVIGAGAPADDRALAAFVHGGGRVLVLAGEEARAPLGVSRVMAERCLGSLHPPAWPEARGLSASDLRWRNTHAAWILHGGAEIGADGLLGRKTMGKGTALFCQLDPERFDADRNTCFRYTRWRQTRALAQILANMGAQAAAAEQVFGRPDRAGALYHPDFREDFALGDDPYRYRRW